MNNKILVGIAAVVVLGIGGFLVYGQGAAPSPSTTRDVYIGAVLSETGFGTSDGTALKKGMELARAELAKKGVKVTIAYQDDKTDPKETINAINLLSTVKKPSIIIGPTWSFLEDAAIPALDKNGIVAITPLNTSEVVSLRSPNVFHGFIRNEYKATAITKWLKENGVKKVGIISTQDTWGQNHIDVFGSAISAAGATTVLTERVGYGSEAQVMPAVIAKMKAAGAEAIVMTSAEDGAIATVKAMSDLSYHPKLIATQGSYDVALRDKKATLDSKDDIYSLVIKDSSEYQALYKRETGEAAPRYSSSGYDALMIAVEAILATDGSAVQVRDYLAGTIDYKGYAARYAFGQNGDIKGGEWLVLRH